MAGLIPMMWGHGTGAEVMARIAAPMVGGMVTAPLLSMLVIPAAWYLIRRRRPAESRRITGAATPSARSGLGASTSSPPR